jgi:hypothetical protein
VFENSALPLSFPASHSSVAMVTTLSTVTFIATDPVVIPGDVSTEIID